MALNIYTEPKSTTKLSIDGEQDAPLSIALDGQAGGGMDFKLYVRNDDTTKYYNNITIAPIDSSGGWLVAPVYVDEGETTVLLDKGFVWRLKEGEIKPVPEDWCAITAGNTLTLSDTLGTTIVGNTTIYLPFWLRVEIPRRENAATIKSIVLRIQATEHLVGY